MAVVTNVLSHYRVPGFHELSDALGERIRFYLLTRSMPHRHYVLANGENDLPVTFLNGWKWRRPPYDDAHLSDIRPLSRSNPDVVIIGSWSEPAFLFVWAWAVVRRKPIVFWIESTGKERPRGRVKEGIKRVLMRRAAACIVPGESASAYCRLLGMAKDRVFLAPNTVDRAFFRRQADELVPYRERLREELGVRGFAALFVGRLVEGLKGVESLIRACSSLEKDGQRLSLLIAGDGPDRPRYERIVAEQSLKRVRFLGTLKQVDLCKAYAAADVLVLPSRSEAWGLVLNEGMEFGLPVIASDSVGAVPDLLPGEENGFIVPVGDVKALGAALGRLIVDEALHRRMSQASRRIIEGFTPERWAEGVLRAVDAVAGELQ